MGQREAAVRRHVNYYRFYKNFTEVLYLIKRDDG